MISILSHNNTFKTLICAFLICFFQLLFFLIFSNNNFQSKLTTFSPILRHLTINSISTSHNSSIFFHITYIFPLNGIHLLKFPIISISKLNSNRQFEQFSCDNSFVVMNRVYILTIILVCSLSLQHCSTITPFFCEIIFICFVFGVTGIDFALQFSKSIYNSDHCSKFQTVIS
jgi:hypothetical protein